MIMKKSTERDLGGVARVKHVALGAHLEEGDDTAASIRDRFKSLEEDQDQIRACPIIEASSRDLGAG